MKKILLAFLTGLFVLSLNTVNAQLNVNVNIGSQPLWGPSGYDHVDYYYMPEIESYYYVPKRQFIYLNRGQWLFSSALPSRYSGYNLYNGYKVVLNSPRPYLSFQNHKVKYAKYKTYHGKQTSIRYRNNSSKSYKAPVHSRNSGYSNGNQSKGNGNQSHGNSNGNGNGNDKGNGGNGKGKH